jgi:MFS family permease
VNIFYGWFIVAAAVFQTAYQSAIFVYGLTAFIGPMSADSGWSYAQISLAASIRGLQIGGLDPLAGLIVDRWPARRLMAIGFFVFAGGTVLISRATSLAALYGGFIIAGIGSSFCLTIVPTTIIARWFKRNIGKASGILALGFAVGGLAVPLVVRLVDTYGWRDVLMYLGLGLLVLGLPLSRVFRETPERYGQFPDGRPPEDSGEAGSATFGPDMREALKMPAFWLIGVAGLFQFTAVHAVTVHMVPYMESLGMARETAAIGVKILSLVGLVMRVAYGALADMFGKKYIYALSNGITAVALILLGALDGSSFAAMALFGVIYGIGVSGATPLRAPIAREYFGVRRFGAIFGLLSIFSTIGGVTGAPVAGWVFDARRTYFPIWYVYAGLTWLGTLLLLMLPKPVAGRPDAVESIIARSEYA